ncbi:MAG TPA: ACT domain-containing protein [Methanothermobacter sp.]|jgi:hypothetical protein|uniref:Amino acid-binding protein n=1 Tax=Methanothermobacter tenebrarum TaxID=680118 RepID=A0ABN6PES8_9EURY|nr:ACT domain-containing protein [Methanothermobacter tenebrarum]MDD3455122.1 ACT domain-containing protein [Methanobacteriales archaeon]MDI6881586.1 ACT domain-containing protein [Methanothermobacter sp.]MDX9693895.1 ACT domain-containing protein [Methanothermobacter sp.]BDH79442.1 amino acid-binding protein [Methanothermobacter tenebrarum]HHW16036.1 ACT domain-containing protein [Methanothermobacter sp.]
MKVEQISIFLENKKGRLWKALNTLKDAGINIRALYLADTSEFGILRLIVPDPQKAKKVLEENDFAVKTNEVIAVELEDKPGGLASILKILKDSQINLEYIYAFVHEKKDKAILFLKADDINRTIKALQEGEARLLTAEEVYKL